MSAPAPTLARGGPAGGPCMRPPPPLLACCPPRTPAARAPCLPPRARPQTARQLAIRATGPGAETSEKDGKEGGRGSSETSESGDGAAPDQSAFSNAVVTTAAVWFFGFLFGVDPWAAARTEPLAASAAIGLACGVPYALSLAAVRSLLGGVWWAEVEGHGALGTLTPLRAFSFVAGVAWADTAAWRGFALAAARGLVEAPAGAPIGTAGASGSASAAAASGADPLALWSASVQAAQAAAASASALAGTLTPPTPLPAAWLAPFLALGVGAAAAAAACYEPPGTFSVDSRAEDPTAPPLTLRELAWAYWREDEEEEAEEEDKGEDDGKNKDAAPPSSWAAGLAARLSGIKTAANEVDAALDALDAASSSSSSAAASSSSSSTKAAAGTKPPPPKKAPTTTSGDGGFWENLLREDEDGDVEVDEGWLAAALDEAAGPPAVVTRWPAVAGPVRAWVVPALVALEGAALAYEALASHSLVAPLVTQAVGLGALWALEVRAGVSGAAAGEVAGGGGGGLSPSEDAMMAALFEGKPDLDTLIARARAAEAGEAAVREADAKEGQTSEE